MSDRFPDWKTIYSERDVDSMPWFYEPLDPDLAAKLKEHGAEKGAFLDIGTGPGTQAVELGLLGFDVTATDLSKVAVEKAKERYQGVSIRFVVDDILQSKLVGPYEYAFDRGCFHVLPPEKRRHYVDTVAALLRPKGILFVKCFSVEQPDGGVGPWRFSEPDIRSIFESRFNVASVHSTVYQGTLDPLPKALFCVLVRR